MQTVSALPVPASSRKHKGNKHLVKGIICLTSENFVIFACAVGTLLTWWGVSVSAPRAVALGAIAWISGFAPWAWRETARGIRRERLGLKQW